MVVDLWNRSSASRSSRSLFFRTSAMKRLVCVLCITCVMASSSASPANRACDLARDMFLDKSEEPPMAKEEVVLYITTEAQDITTAKKNLNKRTTKRPKATTQKTKADEVSDSVEETTHATSEQPVGNNMSGQSHIGDRESQIVVKPTVIVNFRGTVTHRDSDIRLEARRKADENATVGNTPVNVFHINQEIKLERTVPDVGGEQKRSEREGGTHVRRSRDNAYEISVTL